MAKKFMSVPKSRFRFPAGWRRKILADTAIPRTRLKAAHTGKSWRYEILPKSEAKKPRVSPTRGKRLKR